MVTALGMACLSFIFTCKHLACMSLGRICISGLCVRVDSIVYDHHTDTNCHNTMHRSHIIVLWVQSWYFYP